METSVFQIALLVGLIGGCAQGLSSSGTVGRADAPCSTDGDCSGSLCIDGQCASWIDVTASDSDGSVPSPMDVPTSALTSAVASGSVTLAEFPQAEANALWTVCHDCHDGRAGYNRSLRGQFRIDTYYTQNIGFKSTRMYTPLQLWDAFIKRVELGAGNHDSDGTLGMPQLLTGLPPGTQTLLSDDDKSKILRWARERRAALAR